MRKPIQKAISRHSRALQLFMITSCLAAGCAPRVSPSVQLASQGISNSLGCVDVKSKMFDALYFLLDQDQMIPDIAKLKVSIDAQITALVEKNQINNDPENLALLKKQLSQLINSLFAEFKKNPTLTWKEQIQKLIEYEMEDQSSVEIKTSTVAINALVQSIKVTSESLKISCSTAPAGNSSKGPSGQGSSQEDAVMPSGSANKVSVGLNRIVATAYQSCRVLDLPAMDRSTPDVVGISRIGTHADGIGGQRAITNLAAVQNSHYYIRGIASESDCAPVRNNPLIYDYGGEPFISGNTISFQQNAGTGTKVLGVDCSSFVSSSIAVAGLRYRPGVDNKPIFIRQTSTKFIDAAQSGFTCFENVTVTNQSSIRPGDIVGVHGHVVAVDKIGDDPFGLKLLTSAAECNKLNYKNFDVTISQSSPSKNGLGINKYILKDYLDESNKMKIAFVEMGKQACFAYFQNKSLKPSSSEWGFLRHKGTPECIAPRVSVQGESCTKSCF